MDPREKDQIKDIKKLLKDATSIDEMKAIVRRCRHDTEYRPEIIRRAILSVGIDSMSLLDLIDEFGED